MDIHSKCIHRQTQCKQTLEVWEDEKTRWLTFGTSTIQSTIDINDPGQLPSPSCQAMLSALLFIPEPRRVLLLGTGGGSIARYLAHRCPQIQGDAVEISPLVAEITRRFFEFPTPDQGWQLTINDARHFVKQLNHSYDLMVLDISEKDDPPNWITEPEFLKDCQSRLSRRGALAINLIPKNANSFTQALWNIRQIFNRRAVCLSVPDHRNIVVIAFHGMPEFHNTTALKQRIAELTQKWDLTFQEFLDRMIQENPEGSGIF
jgi:spermidine synthase